MRLPKRDIVATGVVAAAGAAYGLWAADAALPGMHSTRAMALVVLGLGFVASASAVVPAFDELIHGSRLYLAVTSLIGLAAFGAGVVVLASSSEAGLAVLMAATAMLWAIATIHHGVLEPSTQQARRGQAGQRPWHGPHAAGT
jgi:hypothetical protein